MKWNCYDLFDHYNTEKNGVPALKEQPIRTDAVLERVQAQTAAHSQPHKRSRIRMTKWAAGIAAAAVLVTGGTTLAAAAGVGGLDAFFHSLIGEETPENPEKLAIAMSERHFGVGSDGLVLIMPSEAADFRMRMFNLDGSEGKMCGNASRCVGKYVYERGLTEKTTVAL